MWTFFYALIAKVCKGKNKITIHDD